jgi:hypothetical protein
MVHSHDYDGVLIYPMAHCIKMFTLMLVTVEPVTNNSDRPKKIMFHGQNGESDLHNPNDFM